MARSIQHKRGLEKNIPALKPGELAIATDTKKLLVGTNDGNIDITNKIEVDHLATQLINTEAQISKRKAEINDINLVADGRKAGFEKGCIVSFINDDGNKGQYHDLFPIMQEIGAPYGQAIFTGQFDKHTKEMMENIMALGGDLSSHTVSHPRLPTLTEAEIETELRDSRQWFSDQGIPCDYIVYPNGEVDDRVRRIAKKYYKFGVSTEEKLNSYPIEDFSIKRITMGTFFGDAGGKNTYEYYKSKLDEAIQNKQWIIYMLHANTPEFNDTQKQHLRNIVADIKAAGIPIMAPTKAYEYYSNALKVGDNSTGTGTRQSNSKYLAISKFGDISTNIFTPTEMTRLRLNAYGLKAVPANGTQQYDFVLNDSRFSNLSHTEYSVSFYVNNKYENGLFANMNIKNGNTLTLSLSNMTSAAISPADRVLKVTLIKNVPEVFPSQSIVQ